MQHAEVIVFFAQIGLMLAVALVFGQLMRRMGQPAVLGELLGGVLLGPTLFGAVAPSAWGWLFPATGSVTTARDAVLRIGMLFFLFVALVVMAVVTSLLSGMALKRLLGGQLSSQGRRKENPA